MRYANIPVKFNACSGASSKIEFESSVISYGSQARKEQDYHPHRFESSVISYGSQANYQNNLRQLRFESSVISYGSQAFR